MEKDYIKNIEETVFNSPLWVQETVFLDLKKHIQEQFGSTQFSLVEQDLYPAYVPALTFKGKRELETHEHNLESNIYKCFASILQGKRIADIAMNNFLTLEQASGYIAFGIENEFIKQPDSLFIHSAILYIGSKIRLGEYIKRLKKIDTIQLDDVLRKQKQNMEENPNAKKHIGEILIDMGYIANNDIDAILALKEDSKKRCFAQNTPHETSQNSDAKYAEMLAKINKLTQENNLLKEKLRAIFNLQNKNK